MSDRPRKPDPDVELIKRVKTGDKSAFNTLVVKYQGRVYSLTLRMVSNHHLAEELTQEIFLKVYQKIGSFRGEAMFSTWLYQVSANHTRNKLKYLKRRAYFRTQSLDQPLETQDGEMPRQVADDTFDPEKMAGSAEIRGIVQSKIADLPEDYRLVILLRDIQGLSYEEIAKVTGAVEGTIKSRLHRARNMLKESLRTVLSEGI
ncbi:MAG: sigma-70 family RNA polymerase sigma factor [Candidatus Alcyoniella australis]|nr:sigma-70 family RNA polymerase sigma factor [Candidatus Alcyoniella australis]